VSSTLGEPLVLLTRREPTTAGIPAGVVRSSYWPTDIGALASSGSDLGASRSGSVGSRIAAGQVRGWLVEPGW